MARASIHDDAVYNARATRPASGGGHRARPVDARASSAATPSILFDPPPRRRPQTRPSQSISWRSTTPSRATTPPRRRPPTRDPRTPHRRSPPARASSRGLTRRCRSRDVRGRRGGSFVVGESSTIVRWRAKISASCDACAKVANDARARRRLRAKGPRGDEEGRRHEGDGLREEKKKIERVSARMRVSVWAVSGSSRADAVGEVDDAQLCQRAPRRRRAG